MAVSILTDATIIVNGVTLSDHANKVTTTDNRAKKDITGFGAANLVWSKGLGDAGVTVTFFQDFAAAKTHATLQPLISSTTPVTIEVRGTSAARSTTNPAFLMSGLLFNYAMLDGSIGEPSMITAEFANGAQAGVTYPTA